MRTPAAGWADPRRLLRAALPIVLVVVLLFESAIRLMISYVPWVRAEAYTTGAFLAAVACVLAAWFVYRSNGPLRAVQVVLVALAVLVLIAQCRMIAAQY